MKKLLAFLLALTLAVPAAGQGIGGGVYGPGTSGSGSGAVAAQPGEFGVVDTSYAIGLAQRYGMTCNGTTDYENNGLAENWKASAALPGGATLPSCYYASGFSLSPWHSYSDFTFLPNSVLKAIWHQIAPSTPAQGACTITAGAVTSYALKASTVTITIAAPGVVTWNSHGLTNGTAITLSNSGGALPSPLVNGQNYYAVNVTTNTFQVSATSSGSGITTTGSQSGTQTATVRGENYFNTPAALAIASGGGNILHGFSATVTMELNNIQKFNGGSGYTAGQVINGPNSTQFTVGSVDANGTILTVSITSRGNMADMHANTYYNRYYDTDKGAVVGSFFALVDGRVNSATIATGGSGGASLSCTSQFDYPKITKTNAYGQITSGGRLGVSNTVDNYIESFYALNDATRFGQGQCGAHIASNTNLTIGKFISDGTTAQSGLCGWGALVIDDTTGLTSRNVKINYALLKNNALHGFVQCTEAFSGTVIVEGFGLSSVDNTVEYCGPAAHGRGIGVYARRPTGTIGGDTLRVSQNDGVIAAAPATTFTGAIALTALTTSGVSGTPLAIGTIITNVGGTAVLPGTYITAGSGSSWTVSKSQTVGSQSMSSTTAAAYSILIDSTGITPSPVSAPADIQFPLTQAQGWGVMLGNVLVTQAARLGAVSLGDVDNVDGSFGLSVTYSTIQVQASGVVAQTAGYPLIVVNNPGNASVDANSELFGGPIVIRETGAVGSNVSLPLQPDAFKCASAAVVRASIIRIPQHGAGNSKFIDWQCRLFTTIDMDQIGGANIPSTGPGPLITAAGTGTAGSVVVLNANSTSQNQNQALLSFSGTGFDGATGTAGGGGINLSGTINRYRNTNVATSGTNYSLNLNNLRMLGEFNGQGTGISLAGTLVNAKMLNVDVSGFDVGITGTPTITGKFVGNNVQAFSNTTTQISASTLPKFTDVFAVNGQSVAGPLTVATLPASPVAGQSAFVTDATACVKGSAPTGGASTFCEVMYNGSAWLGR